jgi:hypothetical protein
LFRIDDTCTYGPPIWERTLAYSFSAPMASTTPEAPAGGAPRAGPAANTAAASPAAVQAAARRARMRAAGRGWAVFMVPKYTETQSHYKSQTQFTTRRRRKVMSMWFYGADARRRDPPGEGTRWS